MPVFVSTFNAIAPYLDSVAAILAMAAIILVMAIGGLWIWGTGKDKRIEEIIDDRTKDFKERIEALEKMTLDCQSHRLIDAAEISALKKIIEGQQKEIDELGCKNDKLQKEMSSLTRVTRLASIKR